MKQHFRTCVLAAAMALAVSGVARAHDDDDDDVKPCRLSTLHGLYLFAASGFNIVSGVPQPKAIVELIDFNGDGIATSGKTTVSRNGMILRSNGAPGTYALDRDCTGTQVYGRRGEPRI